MGDEKRGDTRSSMLKRAQDDASLLAAMIAGLTPERRRTLVARIEASLLPKGDTS